MANNVNGFTPNLLEGVVQLVTKNYTSADSNQISSFTITNVSMFQYVHLVVATGSAYISSFQVQRAATGYTGLIKDTDFSINTSSSNGAQSTTSTPPTTVNCMYNENRLLLSEAYRRIYPVIRDKNRAYY